MGKDIDNEQLELFPKNKFVIDKPIRLIELFAGIGSQAKALENLGADFEHYKVVELDKYAISSYNAIHGTNFEPMDITKVNGNDLNIVDTDKYIYIDLFVSMSRFEPSRSSERNGKRK